MIFSMNAQDLLEGLNTVTRALSARPAKQILEGVLISADDGRVQLTCSDGSLVIEYTNAADIQEEGQEFLVMVPAEGTIGVLIEDCAGGIDVKLDAVGGVVSVERDVPADEAERIKLLVAFLGHLDDGVEVGRYPIVQINTDIGQSPEGAILLFDRTVFFHTHDIDDFLAIDVAHIGKMALEPKSDAC